MAEGGGSDRRREPRVTAPDELEVMVESFGTFLEQYAHDISLGGMFLRTPAPPPVGTRVRFAFRLADGAPLIRGVGEVVWRREPGDAAAGPPGMGVRFAELDPQGRELVRRVVAERLRERPVTVGWGDPFEEAAEGEGGVEPDREAADVFALPEEQGGSPPPAPETGGEGEIREVLERLPEPEQLPAAPDEAGPAGPDPLADVGRPLPAELSDAAPLVPARRSPLPLVGVAVAVILAVVGFAGWWQRTSSRSGGSSAGSATPAATTTPTVVMEVGTGGAIWRLAAATPGLAAEEGGGTGAPEEESRSPHAQPPPSATAPRATGEPGPAATPTPHAHPTPRPHVRPATAVTAIRWRREGGATVVTLDADGSLAPGRVRLLRLEDPPRVLVRVRGIERGYPRPEIAVGTPQLHRIRIGLHPELRPPELYVVLDLTSPAVRARRRGNSVLLEGG